MATRMMVDESPLWFNNNAATTKIAPPPMP